MLANPASICTRRTLCTVVAIITVTGSLLTGSLLPSNEANASDLRRTATVLAVEKARPSVVNIHGQKMISADMNSMSHGKTIRRVNGMGTGVVIDPRGYVITNHHVIDGVRPILVTLASGKTVVARRVSHDRETDLAIIRIDLDNELPVIRIGTSSDLMVGEPTIAVGNAYGYEHTVTTGIISSLHRTVHVSDKQMYKDQIQTSAGINPGNSGGPLLNIDGEMIGINVAVRAGAQNIAFAIPVDSVMEIAAKLMSAQRIDGLWHGMVAESKTAKFGEFVVGEVEAESPAEACGIRSGDRIASIGETKIARALDLERALLGREDGEEVKLLVYRNDRLVKLNMVVTTPKRRKRTTPERVWSMIGLRLRPISSRHFEQVGTNYRGGMEVTSVRTDSQASRQGVRRGDVLVGMHKWETVTMDNIAYVLNYPGLSKINPVDFYVVRDAGTKTGHFSILRRANSSAGNSRSARRSKSKSVDLH